MSDGLDEPMARAEVTWLTAEQGGHRPGPPTAPVYAATCVFPLGDDASVRPGWPAAGDALSIQLQPVDPVTVTSTVYDVDFLARDLARPFLHPGADLLVMEGPRVVAAGRILGSTAGA